MEWIPFQEGVAQQKQLPSTSGCIWKALRAVHSVWVQSIYCEIEHYQYRYTTKKMQSMRVRTRGVSGPVVVGDLSRRAAPQHQPQPRFEGTTSPTERHHQHQRRHLRQHPPTTRHHPTPIAAMASPPPVEDQSRLLEDALGVVRQQTMLMRRCLETPGKLMDALKCW